MKYRICKAVDESFIVRRLDADGQWRYVSGSMSLTVDEAASKLQREIEQAGKTEEVIKEVEV